MEELAELRLTSNAKRNKDDSDLLGLGQQLEDLTVKEPLPGLLVARQLDYLEEAALAKEVEQH